MLKYSLNLTDVQIYFPPFKFFKIHYLKGFVAKINLSLEVKLSLSSLSSKCMRYQVTVYTAPVFTQVPSDVNLETGEALELVCSATGLPTPEIVWKLNGVEDPSLNAEVDFPGTSR